MALFEDFEDEFGPPDSQQTVSEDTIQAYTSALPAELLQKWREVGWASYSRGLLWFTDPAQFDGLIEEWAVKEAHVFLRTAFAHLYVWHEGAAFSLDVHTGSLSRVTTDITLMFGLLTDPEIKERILRVSLFEEARALLGSPYRDECYGFEPALSIGGPGTLDTIRRVKIREHLGILAQLVR